MRRIELFLQPAGIFSPYILFKMQKQQKNARATNNTSNPHLRQLQALKELQAKFIPTDPRAPIERQQLIDLYFYDLNWHFKDYDTCANLLRMLHARFLQVISEPKFLEYSDLDEWEDFAMEVHNILSLCRLVKGGTEACTLADQYLRETYPEDYVSDDL